MSHNAPANESVLIVGISGSLRATSYTRYAVEMALLGAREAGAETRLLDLRDYELAFCDGRKDETSYPPGVERLRRDVQAAQGIILGTPEYHASFSGVLKNALDLMGFEEFEGKMIGLIGVSGGRTGAFDAVNSLRTVGRALHAWVVPEQVSLAEVWRVFGRDGRVKDEDAQRRLMEVGRQVARFAYLHSSSRTLEFVRQWEKAPVNPGAGGR